MNVSRSLTWAATDQVAFLHSPECAQLVTQLLEASAEVPRASWTVQALQSHHRPGAGVSVLFEATAPGAEPVFVGASTETLPESPAHVATLSDGERQVFLWLHPHDPRLPGLASASVPDTVQRLWAPTGVSELLTLAYRPLRRAVLRAELVDGRALFIKVLHAGADLLRLRHQLLAEAGVPAPRVVEPVPGLRAPVDVVVLEQAAGRSVAQALMDRHPEPLAARELIAVLDRLPERVGELPGKAAWSDRIREHSQAAEVAFAGLGPRIRGALHRVLPLVEEQPVGRTVPVHGDLYEANVFVEDGRVSALLDLDALGPGHRVDDLACYLGHLCVLPELSAGYAGVPGYVEGLAPDFEADALRQGSTPAALWGRAAAVALSLVAGIEQEDHEHPAAAAARRLDTVEALLARAEAFGRAAHAGRGGGGVDA